MRARWLAVLLVLPAAGCGGNGEDGSAPVAQLPAPAPLETCSKVYAGDAQRPDVLIASDLPLQGTYANDGIQATKAVLLELEQRGFRAGRFRVGYVSCDGATPRDDISPAKCRRAGRAYVAAEDVVAVIGPFFSSCAIHMMATLNRARLAQVGPGNTYVGLTRSGPGVPKEHPARFQPTGKRNFVRLAAPDDLQGRAHAQLAHERGDRTAYVLSDGLDAYSLGTAHGFRRAARDLGIEIVGSERWDPEADSYRALVARVARSGADAVFLGGYIVSNGGTLIRELRAALGDEVTLMGAEALLPITVLRARAGPAAEGLLVTLSSIATERLTGPGADFLRRYREATDQDPCCYTVHVAQATHVLLDAIAASDGTRRSVTHELLGLKVADGIIGDFSFDANGDVSPPLVSVYRITDGKQKLFDVVENP